jgi:deoxyribodipyrimidine photolyase-related protein
MAKTLRLILGDQLDKNISSLHNCDKANDVILMCEVWDEATYVKHHKKKIAFIFSAMRHFAAEIIAEGFHVHYTKLTDTGNAGSFIGEVQRAIKEYKPAKITVTHPGEYRVLQDMLGWESEFGIPVEIRDDDRFLCSIEEFKNWAGDKKGLRMEFFYREMRKKFSILLAGDNPVGGEWNYDIENRKVPNENDLFLPQPVIFEPDEITQEVIKLVAERFGNHFGDLEPFNFAVTRTDALKALHNFIGQRLQLFGDYQDAMLQQNAWLYHSQISFYLNCGLLNPLEVVKATENAYRAKLVPLNSVEGFIRQLIGWREYVRGVYWLKMPGYENENFLDAKRKLPWFYWDAKTDMNCLHQCITNTMQNAYAHHIQRLMVLGNFALLTGIDPAEVNEWYLIVYADAYQWVELPNVTGMILFADGGYLGSKPYAASGAYINKMSNYCKSCRYKVNQKNGEDACPFNYLYWNFMIQNSAKLEKNQRLEFTYKTLAKMSEDKIDAVISDAGKFLNTLK